MSRKNTTAERARYKKIIHRALYKNADVREYVTGNINGKSHAEIQTLFKDHVKSHLFVDDTIKDAGTYIFYDILFPRLGTNVKTCLIIMYAICQRDMLENNESEKYQGDRIDALTQMIEDTIINDSDVCKEFGIGPLVLDSLDIYNSNRFYGTVLRFTVPNFRWSN